MASFGQVRDGVLCGRDVGDGAELQAQGGAGVLALLLERAVGVLKERALEEEQRAQVLEGLEDDDVRSVVRVARLAPLELLIQPGPKQHRPQGLELGPPRAHPLDVLSDARILRHVGHG
jgi:hypothetical protein